MCVLSVIPGIARYTGILPLLKGRVLHQFRDVVRIRSCCEGSTPTINELMNMLSSDLEEEDFKRYWMMFTVTAFLCPTTYECASPDYLSALEGPSEEIRSYDWSSGVFQKLSVSMKTFVDCGLQGALCGCLVVPLVSNAFSFSSSVVVMLLINFI